MTIDMDYYRKINGMFGTVSKIDYLQKQATKSVNKAHSHVLSTFEILVNSDKAEDIVVDNTTNTKCIFDYSKTSKDTKTELASYTKEMWIEVGIISVGSVVKHTDKVSLIENTYIVVSKQEDSNGYDLCYIQRCNNTLQFYDSSSTLHSIPCIISKGLISLDEQKVISTLDSEIAIQISNTSITRQIGMNDVFKIGMRNYSVTDINDITVNGLLLIKMQYSEVEQVFPVYSLTILNGDSIQVNKNDPLTINAQVKIDGIIVSIVPDLIFSSSDITKATINSITGVVTILDVGNVVFSCKLASDLSVLDTISVEIIEEIQNNFTYTITANTTPITEVKSGQTKTYTAHKFNNGIEIVDAEFNWSVVSGITPIDKYVFTVLNNTQSTIKANAYVYYIDLFATDRDLPENSISVNIKLRSVM